MNGSVDNLLMTYSISSPWERERGVNWYTEANDYASFLAHRYNLSIEQTAGVLAVLSPNNKWERNKQDANLVIRLYLTGERDVWQYKACTYKNNVIKAWEIIDGNLDIISGDKVTCFYKNILEPHAEKEITVDMWAYRAWVYDASAQMPGITEKEYQLIADHYREGAGVVGLAGHQFQAVVWLTVRGGGLRQLRMEM